MIRAVVAVLVVSSTSIGSQAATVPVTECGRVAAGDVGVLQADVVCPPGEVFHLEEGATLDLDGHGLVGDEVRCVLPGSDSASPRRCTIVGDGVDRGLLAARAFFAIGEFRGFDLVPPGRIGAEMQLVVEDVTADCGGVRDETTSPIVGWRRADVRSARVQGCYAGIKGGGPDLVLTARSIELLDNTHGITQVRSFVGEDVVVSGSEDIAVGADKRVKARALQIDGGRMGVSADSVKLADSTVQGVSEVGIAAIWSRVALSNSSVSGSGDVDIVSRRRPALRKGSSCGTSRSIGPDPTTWGVCSGD